MILLAFVAGCALLQLPVSVWPLLALLLSYLIWQHRTMLVIVLFFFGLMTTLFHQLISQSKNLPDKTILRNAMIEGDIFRIPHNHQTTLSICIKIRKINKQSVSGIGRLFCYRDCPVIHVGDKVSMLATLKKPNDLRNPGSFSFQQWSRSHHIDRVGYFKAKTMVVIGQHNGYRLEKIRLQLLQKIKSLNLSYDAKGLMAALTIGISDGIQPNLWRLFRQTGTAHLMVISGAHVGLIAGFCFYFFNRLWCCIPFVPKYLPSKRFAATSAFFCALGYALIAGFAIPAQRSVIMAAAMLFRYVGQMYLSSWQAWQIALALCVCIEPHSLLMPGFYLSFSAVAILLLVNQRFRYKGIKQLLVLQTGCLLGLMPLTLYLFNYQANNGLFANFILIPYVSIILLPLALVKLILLILGWSHVGDWIFNQLVYGLVYMLSCFDQLAFINIQFAIQAVWQVCLVLFGLAVLLIFPVRFIIFPATMLVCIALIPKKIQPNHDHAQINILDVGQGLAVLISTQHHHLLYDTGLKFFGGGDMGERVILPFFRHHALNQLDTIVISHPDLDHRGGYNSVHQVYPKAQLISDSPSYYHRGKNCHTYPAWTWDGIKFQFFPLTPFAGNRNNHSCVLKVSSPSMSILLTGDIEKPAEDYLIDTYRQELASNFLLIAHHGSKTSSTKRFLQAVSPTMAVISSGLDNQYRFPHKLIINRLKKLSIKVKNTAEDGMVTIKL